MTVDGLALLALAAYRAALLVTSDELTEPWRRRLAARYPPTNDHDVREPRLVVAFVNCGRCVGTWTALAATVAGRGLGLVDSWPLAAVAWPAVAGAVALLVAAVP